MNQQKFKNMISDLKEMSRNHAQSLYFHMCQPAMQERGKDGEPAFVTCEPSLLKPRCWACYVKATKLLWAHHMDGWED